MIRIKQVKIHQYKCITDEVRTTLEKDITIIIGKNEVGKTSALEALAKSNYYDKKDSQFHYEPEYDYPKTRKKELEQQEAVPLAVTVQYEVSEELNRKIEQEMLISPCGKTFTRTTNYKGQHQIISNDFKYEPDLFWAAYAQKTDKCIRRFVKNLSHIYDLEGYSRLLQHENGKCSEEEQIALSAVKKYFLNRLNWDNPLEEYVFRTYLMPSIPQFVYYDEYFMMPTKMSLNRLKNGKDLSGGEKTAKALLLLADVDIETLMDSQTSHENKKAEIELANSKITGHLQKYWSTNPDLRVEMALIEEHHRPALVPEKKGFLGLFKKNGSKIPLPEREMWIEVRIHDIKNMISIPFEKRSKGFRWYFSFLVWFLAVERDNTKNYCFLLDEPGQDLHTTAQQDLLRLLKDLSEKSQFVLTTHSLVMANDKNARNIRCMYDDGDNKEIALIASGQGGKV